MKAFVLALLFAAPSAFAGTISCKIAERPGAKAVIDAEAGTLQIFGAGGRQIPLDARTVRIVDSEAVAFDRANECLSSVREGDDGAFEHLLECRAGETRATVLLEIYPGRESGVLESYLMLPGESVVQEHLQFTGCRP